MTITRPLIYAALLAFGWAATVHAQQQSQAAGAAASPSVKSVSKHCKGTAKAKPASQHATDAADGARARAVVGLSSGTRGPIDQYQNAVTPPPATLQH